MQVSYSGESRGVVGISGQSLLAAAAATADVVRLDDTETTPLPLYLILAAANATVYSKKNANSKTTGSSFSSDRRSNIRVNEE